jgi:hypothetical protein
MGLQTVQKYPIPYGRYDFILNSYPHEKNELDQLKLVFTVLNNETMNVFTHLVAFV